MPFGRAEPPLPQMAERAQGLTSYLDGLPGRFRIERSARAILALDEGCQEGLEAAGYDAAGSEVTRRSRLEGRMPLRELDVGDGTYVLREFHHGGLLRWLTGRRYAEPSRAFRELALSDFLERAGVRTPRIVAARARRAAGSGWLLDIVSRKLGDTIDLGAVLDGRVELHPRARRVLLGAVGRMAARLHELGFLHADLQPKNLLASPRELAAAGRGEQDDIELVVLDLEGSRAGPALTRHERRDNLRRLLRYVERHHRGGGEDRRLLSRADRYRVLAAYEADRQARRDDWHAIDASRSRRGPLHRLGWWFEALFHAS